MVYEDWKPLNLVKTLARVCFIEWDVCVMWWSAEGSLWLTISYQDPPSTLRGYVINHPYTITSLSEYFIGWTAVLVIVTAKGT